MWFYNEESSEIEVITHLVSGVQVLRSANEIWRRGIEQDEMKIGDYKDEASAVYVFDNLVDKIMSKGDLA